MYGKFSLKELIMSSQGGDKENCLALINKFDPLLKKYSAHLRYEDSYNDLLIYLIELIKKMDFNILKSSEDKYIISYINTCIKREYVNLIRDKIKYNKIHVCFSDLTDKQRYWLESLSSNVQNNNNLFIFKLISQLKILCHQVNFRI